MYFLVLRLRKPYFLSARKGKVRKTGLAGVRAWQHFPLHPGGSRLRRALKTLSRGMTWGRRLCAAAGFRNEFFSPSRMLGTRAESSTLLFEEREKLG